jgi:UDP-N-acetylglucosamine 2-epimerase (non-hydrolysing)
VDDKNILSHLVRFVSEIVTRDLFVIWPVHPRTYKNLQQFEILAQIENNTKLFLTHPLGYHEMLRLNMGAKMVLTDSGGLQEECTVLGTPCLTLRLSTERPITLRQNGGATILVGNNIDNIGLAYKEALTRKRLPFRPELWDGKTAVRIVNELITFATLEQEGK